MKKMEELEDIAKKWLLKSYPNSSGASVNFDDEEYMVGIRAMAQFAAFMLRCHCEEHGYPKDQVQ